MSQFLESLQDLLKINSKDTLLSSAEILLKLLDNIIKEPGNPKYRSFRIENKTIKEKLLSAKGMKKILTEIGFEENAIEFALPGNVILTDLKKSREAISTLYFKLAEPSCVTISSEPGTSKIMLNTRNSKKKIDTGPLRCSKPFAERTTFTPVLDTENIFLKSLEYHSDLVMQYDDPDLLKIGRTLIPFEKIQMKAVEKLRCVQKAIKSNKYSGPECCVKDLIIIELANWFNENFFEWTSNNVCKICQKESPANSVSQENGIRVEVLNCCGYQSKFYRYNDIAYLLRSRKGRCGEYANCFTFLCMCLGYDARYVFATFDHVWTEVYSYSQRKWIHIDPSDNIVDAPLMYQQGWKRKIDYVIAFSTDDVQDVTWRYSSNHKETLALRNKCTESDLLDAIMLLREKRLKGRQVRQRYLVRRHLNELVELMIERKPTEDENRGRSSGSALWRQLRGEDSCDNFFVFTLNDTEKENKEFNLRYSCSEDRYERYLKKDNGAVTVIETSKSWQACVFSSINMFRKVERDWKMVYLARQENINEAEMVWSFDFSKSNLRIKKCTLKFERAIYESARIEVQTITKKNKTDIVGTNEFKIVAKLSGGKGDIAWQHTQLFRQELHSNDFPFDLNITFQ